MTANQIVTDVRLPIATTTGAVPVSAAGEEDAPTSPAALNPQEIDRIRTTFGRGSS